MTSPINYLVHLALILVWKITTISQVVIKNATASSKSEKQRKTIRSVNDDSIASKKLLALLTFTH